MSSGRTCSETAVNTDMALSSGTARSPVELAARLSRESRRRNRHAAHSFFGSEGIPRVCVPYRSRAPFLLSSPSDDEGKSPHLRAPDRLAKTLGREILPDAAGP